jgi:hypothetical protein
MLKLARSDLLTLEAYHEQRPDMRRAVLAHKARRRVALGAHVTLYFEDRLTVQYQIQEMLRAERIYAGPAIEDELAAYNPLIPDGGNLKATLMLEYTDVAARQAALARLTGIEHRVWLRGNDGLRVVAIADEDLERSEPDKTAAVHFLRFELDASTIAAFKRGEAVHMGVDHEHYRVDVRVGDDTVSALAADLA